MALKLGELVAYLKADDGPLRAGLKGAGDKLKDFGQSMKTGLKVAGAAAGAAVGAALSLGVSKNLEIGEARAKLTAQLGLTKEDAATYGELAGTVYADNFGGSLADVNEAIRTVKLNLGDIGDIGEEAFTQATEAALTLSSVFGVDVAQASEAAGKLVKNGLAKDSTEAFDILAEGFTSGVDKSGDFLDTINEYSPQFAKLGISGTQMLGILQDGLKGGARNTDVIADAFKEFSLLAIDKTSGAGAAFKALGLNAKQTAKDIAGGGPAAATATQAVLAALLAVEDPMKRNELGLATFGTTWEDTMRGILPSVVEMGDAADTTGGSMQEMTDAAGSSGAAQIETFKRSVEGWITAQTGADGAMATTVAGLTEFGPAALTTAASIGTMVTGLASMNAGAALSAIKTGAMTAANWLWQASLGVAKFAAWLAGAAAHAVASVASAAATAAWTAAQWLWQASISAAGLARFLVVSAAHKVATAASAVATGLWTGAQWLLNAALTANPIGIVIAIIAALVVAIVIAYKKSDTFRTIVQAAMKGVVAAFGWLWDKAKAVFGWIKKNWRTIFAIMTGPIGLAVRWIVSNFGKIMTAVKKIPGKIKGAFSDAKNWLKDAGRAIVEGLWNGITGLAGWLVGKVQSFIENTVPGPIRSALGIGSPSKVARKLSQWVGVGLGLGLDDMHATVSRAATRLATAAVAGPAGMAIAGIPAPRAPGGYGSAGAAGGRGGVMRLDGDSALVVALKKLVREQGGGDVQVAFGDGRPR